MAKELILVCKNCQKDFKIKIKEFSRQVAKGRDVSDFCCSRSCSMHGNSRNKKGEFSWHLRKIKQREHDHDLDENFLQELWDKQKGHCAISGLQLKIKDYKEKNSMTTASLDRIDSSRGYCRDNVQWTCYAINLAKNDFDNEDVKEFIKTLKNSNKAHLDAL